LSRGERLAIIDGMIADDAGQTHYTQLWRVRGRALASGPARSALIGNSFGSHPFDDADGDFDCAGGQLEAADRKIAPLRDI
jgi:hypothetical protein